VAAVVGAVVVVAFWLAVGLLVLGLLVGSVGDGPSCGVVDDLRTGGNCGEP
jgi:hypothetical protein